MLGEYGLLNVRVPGEEKTTRRNKLEKQIEEMLRYE